ncbi:MAG: IclR family transcriptional regulator [Haloplanus sp.]
MNSQNTRTIDAVETACRILNALQERGPVGVTELAGELDLPKSVAHSHLATLTENKYVVKDGGEYRLSFRNLSLARHVREQFGAYDVIVDELDNIADETGEVAQFGVEENGEVVYLGKSKGQTGVETASSVGSSAPVHSTSLGKAILSQLPEERVVEILNRRGMPRKTENTIVDRDEFLEELQRIRERGYAIDNEENLTGVRCVAAPVGGSDGTILGALSVTGPSRRMEDERIESELADTITRTANVIEINSKFS